MASQFRALPSVDRVMSDHRMEALARTYSRRAVLDLVRDRLALARRRIADEGGAAPAIDDVASDVAALARSRFAPSPRRVINATGVVLHTNLGRAPLSEAAADAVREAAAGYGDLELDLDSGRRGSRQAAVARHVSELTGAEAALVVNNNASAVLLGLAAIAAGKQVIVSRGEAVEIGGGFRIPDVLKQSGAQLVEVGTTNRTYARDFEDAIGDDTGALLLVHASNFRVVGFTHSPTIAELVEIGRRRGVPVLHDLGSGCLLDTEPFGLAHEPMPQESAAAGVDVMFFSGDKLLGGPQAGIIAGSRELVEAVSRHPLARAMRIDKLSLAALNATLLHYVKGEAESEVPVWRMIGARPDDVRARAERWRRALAGRECDASVVEATSAIGGGSLPGEMLPTWALSVSRAGAGASRLAERLRAADPPVVGRVDHDALLLDPRTVLPDEDDALLAGLVGALED